MSYRTTYNIDCQDYKVSASIRNNEKMSVVLKTQEGSTKKEALVEVWILVNGNKVAIAGVATEVQGLESYYMTEEQYNDLVSQIKANEEQWNALWADEANYAEVNAFKMTFTEDSFLNDGVIGFAVAIGIVTVVLVAYAIRSIVLYVKADKTSIEEVAIEEKNETTEEAKSE